MIRDTVRDFILKYPQWVLYVRRHPFLHHTCWDSASNSPTGTCAECLSTGYMIRIERQPVRRVLPYREERDVSLPGFLSQAHAVLYMTYRAMPKDGDLVIEVDWNVDDALIPSKGLPKTIYRVYRVMHSVPMRQASHVSFFAVGCNPYDFEITNVIPDAIRINGITTGPY